MNKIQDCIILWRGFGRPRSGNWESKCRVRIWHHDSQSATVVLFSDLDEEDSGTSITNASENIATLVRERFGLEDNNITWIEHYPRHRQKYEPPFDKEDFALIEYKTIRNQLKHPKWRYISKSQVEKMVNVDLGMNDVDFLPVLDLGVTQYV
ncbi:MAG: hypothetical protein WBA93_01980 [Microcoleaceae cyanobacterium]